MTGGRDVIELKYKRCGSEPARDDDASGDIDVE
jgi:hypothetical protein